MKTLTIVMAICFMFGCDGTPDSWSCPKGSIEKNGLCFTCPEGFLFNEKTERCDEVAGAEAMFLKYDVFVRPEKPTMITASYELSLPARIYYLFTNDVAKGWELRGFTGDKVVKNHNDFTSFKPESIVYWRLEARNDDDKIVDTKQGAVVMPPL